MAGLMNGNVEIKLFQVSDTDWWAGADAVSVKAAYIEFNNIGDDPNNREDWGVYETPEELSDEAMDRLKYVDDEGTERVTRTFREQLQKEIDEAAEFPVMFASSEY